MMHLCPAWPWVVLRLARLPRGLLDD